MRYATRIRYLALLLILFSLFGCSRPSRTADIPPSASPLPTETSTEVSSEGKTVIVYARTMDDTNATKLLIDEFNKQSPSIFVKYQELATDSDSLYNQLNSQLSAESAEYDIIDFDYTWCAEFAEKGYLLNLGAFITADGIDTSAYIQSAYESVCYNGGVYGLPRNVAAGALFYRKSTVSRPPETWDDLINFCDMASYGENEYGFSFAGIKSETLSSEAIEFIMSYGGSVLDEDGKCIVMSPASVTGLTVMHELYHAPFTSDKAIEMTYIDSYVDFAAGGSVFMRNWTSVFTSSEGRSGLLSAGSYNIAPLPKGSVGSAALLSGSMAAINANSNHRNEAWEFVKFLSGEKGQKIITLNSGRFPVIASVCSDPLIVYQYPRYKLSGLVSAVSNSVAKPATPLYRSLSLIIQEEVYSFLKNEQSAEAALSNIENRFNGIPKSPGQTSEE